MEPQLQLLQQLRPVGRQLLQTIDHRRSMLPAISVDGNGRPLEYFRQGFPRAVGVSGMGVFHEGLDRLALSARFPRDADLDGGG